MLRYQCLQQLTKICEAEVGKQWGFEYVYMYALGKEKTYCEGSWNLSGWYEAEINVSI